MKSGSRLEMPAVAGRVLATLAGLVLPLAFAPFGWYPVVIPVLATLFVLQETRPREAALRGFAFGAGAFASGTYWLYHSVRVIGGTPLPVALILLGGLVCIMAAWYSACGYVAARLRGSLPGLHRCFVAPAAFVLAEWLRGWFLSGFPWLTVGYAATDGPLVAWAPLAGVYGLSFIIAMLAGALAELIIGTARGRLVAGTVVVFVAFATWQLQSRQWTSPDGQSLRVALVQGAIPQSIKWRPEQAASTLVRYQMLTLDLRASDLIIWPEAAIPVPSDEVPGYLQNIGGLARARHQQLLVGMLTHDPAKEEEYRNALVAVGEPAGVYDKRHLVPFGEYFPVPKFVRQWLRLMNLPYEDITAGAADQAPLRAGPVLLAPTICYEDVFGAEQLGFLPAAGMLVNVSNDAWFGDSIAPHQHLQMARMRAIETGRYMLRSTNTGVTAIIDEQGRVLAEAPQFQPFVLLGTARSFTGATPYVRTGDYPLVCLCLAIWAAVLAARFRGAPRASSALA